MSFEAPAAGNSNLVARAKGILLQPTAEWNKIDGEPASVKGLITGYAAILAAITPIATLIGSQLFPINVLGIVVRQPIVGAVVGAVVSYVMALVSVFILGLVIEALATQFGGVKDRVQAMKVAVYSSTASWVAGILAIFPALGILGALLGGLYSLFLLYKGLPIVMKAPQDKALGYTAVVVIVAIVVAIVIGMIVAAATAPFAIAAAGAAGLGGYGL